jgi:hypothetical protein
VFVAALLVGMLELWGGSKFAAATDCIDAVKSTLLRTIVQLGGSDACRSRLEIAWTSYQHEK